MIEFSCSCGKKYRLPDRNADREVRCNQCEKTLIVPKRSQAEPVIPLSDQLELIIEPEDIQPVVEQLVVEEKVEKKAATSEIELVIEPKIETKPVTEPAAIQPAAARPEPNPFRIERKTSVAKSAEQERPKSAESREHSSRLVEEKHSSRPVEEKHSSRPVEEKKADQETVEKKVDAIFQSVAAATPSKTAPIRTTPSSASDAPDKAFAADVPLPSGQPVSLFDDRRSGALSCGILVLMMLLLIGVGIVGGVLGFLASGIAGTSFKGNPFQKQAEEIERQLVAEKSEPREADEPGKHYAEAVAAAVQESDAAKRTEAMKQAETLHRSALDEQDIRWRKTRQTAFLGGLAKEFRRLGAEPPEAQTPFDVDFSLLDNAEPRKKTVADWKITKDSPFAFDLRTADGAPVLLSLDGDPTSKKTGKKSTLDELAVVLDDDQSIKGTESHTISLRVDSASAGELCVVWPRSRDAGLAEGDVKKLNFCVYFSGTANAIHKPDKPTGLDKTLELADFRIRLGDAWGDIEFVLTEKERIALCEKGRLTWYALSVPINGDEVWKRTEHGRMSPKNVDFIEFRAKPTGNGVTFWIDNLSIGK